MSTRPYTKTKETPRCSKRIIPTIIVEIEDNNLAFSEPEAFCYLKEMIDNPSFEELHRYFFKRQGYYYLR